MFSRLIHWISYLGFVQLGYHMSDFKIEIYEPPVVKFNTENLLFSSSQGISFEILIPFSLRTMGGITFSARIDTAYKLHVNNLWSYSYPFKCSSLLRSAVLWKTPLVQGCRGQLPGYLPARAGFLRKKTRVPGFLGEKNRFLPKLYFFCLQLFLNRILIVVVLV